MTPHPGASLAFRRELVCQMDAWTVLIHYPTHHQAGMPRLERAMECERPLDNNVNNAEDFSISLYTTTSGSVHSAPSFWAQAPSMLVQITLATLELTVASQRGGSCT